MNISSYLNGVHPSVELFKSYHVEYKKYLVAPLPSNKLLATIEVIKRIFAAIAGGLGYIPMGIVAVLGYPYTIRYAAETNAIGTANDSTLFKPDQSTHNEDLQYGSDLTTAISCCLYPKLAVYVFKKHHANSVQDVTMAINRLSPNNDIPLSPKMVIAKMREMNLPIN